MPKQSLVRKKRPTVSIIGIGRVGKALANALQSAGYPIAALVFRGPTAPQRFPSAAPKTLLLASDRLEQLPPSELLLITTPDDAIEETAGKIAALQKGEGRRVVLHTSGALSSEVLSSLTAAGFLAGSIHPLVSVTGSEDGAEALRGASYCIEGHKVAMLLAERIVGDLKGESFFIKTEQKALYHAAAVIASPHLVALFDLALELLDLSGIRGDKAYKSLLGLVESTVKNLHARDPMGHFRGTPSALTGTFARGDVGTVEKHLKALSGIKPNPPAEALEVYRLLGLRSLKLAKSRGLDPTKIKQITRRLKGSPKKPPKH